MTTPTSADPTTISKSLNFSWPVIRQVGFSHFQLRVLHILLHIHKIQPREWKKKNKRTNTDFGQLQAQEREFVTLCILRAFVDYRGWCILRETSTKATRNTNSSLTVFPHCLLLLTVLLLDFYLKPTALLCPALSTDHLSSQGPSFPRPLPVSLEVLPLCPLSGFRTKAKRFSDRCAHTHTTQRMNP